MGGFDLKNGGHAARWPGLHVARALTRIERDMARVGRSAEEQARVTGFWLGTIMASRELLYDLEGGRVPGEWAWSTS